MCDYRFSTFAGYTEIKRLSVARQERRDKTYVRLQNKHKNFQRIPSNQHGGYAECKGDFFHAKQTKYIIWNEIWQSCRLSVHRIHNTVVLLNEREFYVHYMDKAR